MFGNVGLVVIIDKLLLSIMGDDNWTRMDTEQSLNSLSGCLPERFGFGNVFSLRKNLQQEHTAPVLIRHKDFNLFSVGFEVLTAVVTNTSNFWDVMAYK
jgi:hypothetical protein